MGKLSLVILMFVVGGYVHADDINIPEASDQATEMEAPQATQETVPDKAFDQIMSHPAPTAAVEKETQMFEESHHTGSDKYEALPDFPESYFSGNKKTSISLPIEKVQQPANTQDRGHLNEWRNTYYQKHPAAKTKKIVAQKQTKTSKNKKLLAQYKKSKNLAAKKNSCRTSASQGKKGKRGVASCKIQKLPKKKVAFRNKKQGRLTASQRTDSGRYQD